MPLNRFWYTEVPVGQVLPLVVETYADACYGTNLSCFAIGAYDVITLLQLVVNTE